MLSLLRSDLYRLIRGKALWVITAVLVACMAASAALLNWVAQPEFLLLYADAESLSAAEVQQEISFESSPAGFSATAERDEGEGASAGAGEGAATDASAASRATDAGSAADALGADDAGASVGAGASAAAPAAEGAPVAVHAVGPLDAGSDGSFSLTVDAELVPEDFEGVSADMHRLSSVSSLFGSAFLGGGLLFIASSLLVALFFASDFETRFIRNLPMSRRGRTAYYGEKLLLAALVALWFLVVLVLAALASFALAGFSYRTAESAGELLAWMLLAWLSATVYAWLTALVVWVTRSKGAAIAETLVVSSTFLAALIIQLLTYFSRVAPWLAGVRGWLPSGVLGTLGEGAAALAQPGGVLGLLGVPAAASSLLVLGLWLAACAALSLGICRSRDV